MWCSGPCALSTVPSSHICTPELSPHMLTTHLPLEPFFMLSAWLLLPEAKILLPIQGHLKWDFLFRVFLNCLLSHNPPSPVKLASSLCESRWHFICYVWQHFSCSLVEWLVLCASLMSRGCLRGRKCFLLIFVLGTSRLSEVSKWCLSYFKLSWAH